MNSTPIFTRSKNNRVRFKVDFSRIEKGQVIKRTVKGFATRPDGNLTKKYINFVAMGNGEFSKNRMIRRGVRRFKKENIYNEDSGRFNKRSNFYTSDGKLKNRFKNYEEINGNIKKGTIIAINRDGDVEHFDIDRNLPLALRNFTGGDIDVLPLNNIKRVIERKEEIKGIELVKEISPDKIINIAIGADIIFYYMDQAHVRRTKFIINNIRVGDLTNSNMERLLKKESPDLYNLAVNFGSHKFIFEIFSTRNSDDDFKQLEDLSLRSEKPIKIFNKNLISYKPKTDLNCVKDYLLYLWGGKLKTAIMELGTDDGVNTKSIHELCVKNEIRMIAYNINKEVIKINDIINNKKYKSLYFIAYGNHIYPLKSKILDKKKDYGEYNVIIMEHGETKLIEFLENGILPDKIKGKTSSHGYTEEEGADKISILSFTVGGDKYLCNNDYFKCRDILKKWGMESKIYDGINLASIGSILLPLYIKDGQERPDTFWPSCDKFVKGGFNYHNDKYDDEKYTCEKMRKYGIQTIDKNKCYSYCLSSLSYLIYFDYRQSQNTIINEYNSDENYDKITDHHLYIATPEVSNILMPDENVYTGDILKLCHKEGLRYFIKESMTTKITFNVMRDMVSDIYDKCDDIDAKQIVNFYIGKMEKTCGERSSIVIDNIYNDEESETIPDSLKYSITNGYNVVFKSHTSYIMRNMKPVSIQIKDRSRTALYFKMKKIGLKNKDIVQIKTDSISFVSDKIVETINDFNGWKKEEYKPIPNHKMRKKYGLSFSNRSDDNDNKLYNAYAGMGKSYKVINEIIPQLIKEESQFLILTPSHSTIEEYRKLGYNCNVIQAYTLGNAEIKQGVDTIILDEIGLVDKMGHDFLYKQYLNGMDIIALGDFKQLLPVGETRPFNSPHYLGMLFKHHIQMEKNWRNDFSLKYYDNLINEKLNLIKEVKKHSVKNWNDAEKIICYTNNTACKYNKLKLEKMGEKDMFFIGSYVICKTNKLREKKMFNNFFFYIEKIEGKIITLNNGETLTKSQMKRFFKSGYASTLHGVQGKGFKSYYYAPEDLHFINGRRAYTIISRLIT